MQLAHLNPGGDARLASAVRRGPLAALDSLSSKETCKLSRDKCSLQDSNKPGRPFQQYDGKDTWTFPAKEGKMLGKVLKKGGGGGRDRIGPAQHRHTRVRTYVYIYTHIVKGLLSEPKDQPGGTFTASCHLSKCCSTGHLSMHFCFISEHSLELGHTHLCFCQCGCNAPHTHLWAPMVPTFWGLPMALRHHQCRGPVRRAKTSYPTNSTHFSPLNFIFENKCLPIPQISYVSSCILLIFLVNEDNILSHFTDHLCFFCELHVYILCHLKHLFLICRKLFLWWGGDNSFL